MQQMESSSVTDPKPVSARAISTAPLDRRLSRGTAGTFARRSSRPVSGGDRGSAFGSMKNVVDVVAEVMPSSPTVLRLKALAHAVRARHALGIEKPTRRKYLLQVSEFDTDEMHVGMDLPMAGTQNRVKGEAHGANKSGGHRGAGLGLSTPSNFGARLTCARSLYKLSCQVKSELAIIEGGAIAQIADFSDVEDPTLLRNVAAVLANITTDPSVLAAFVANDGVSALLELSWTPLLDVKMACATALCRLSQNRAHAVVLVRSRAVTELLSLLTVPQPPLQMLVVSCVLNLVFHGHIFPDRVFLGDPHAVQNPLGIMNIVSQLSTSPASSQFAVEALFNLSLYRASCLDAVRGGGAEVLHTLVSQVCRAMDNDAGGSSSRYLASLGVVPPAWTADPTMCVTLLRRAADTLANFSAFTEYHGMLSSYGLKSLSALLSGALRDVGSHMVSAVAEERLRLTVVACSRALANFSSNADLRRHGFSQELVYLATKLALLDHQHYTSSATDARALLRNVVRMLANLSFDSACTATFMELPQVLTLLHAVIVLPPVKEDTSELEHEQMSPLQQEHQQQHDNQQKEERQLPSLAEAGESSLSSNSNGGMVGGIKLGLLSCMSSPPPPWYTQSSPSSASASPFPWTLDMSEDVKEDALVAVLNLAQQGVYANELLRTLDGTLLAAAAGDEGHSRRLRYIYASVLCNLLFDNHLQQLVLGDQVVRALVNGFYFFETAAKPDDGRPAGGDEAATKLPLPPSSSALGSEKARFQTLNLAFDDDQERFLAAICLVTSELMDTTNIELIVALVLAKLRVYVKLVSALSSSAVPSHLQRSQLQRQRPIMSYASASLFALARAATQRRDSQKHFVYSEEAEAVLIAVCGLSASGSSSKSGNGTSEAPSGSGAARCSVTQAFCAATLYHWCASSPVNQRVIQGLIDCCNANEETQSLLACSAAFAITSFTSEGCQQLVQCANLARALNRLGRTGQVECQQYAAIAACNVSAVTCVWSSPELKDFIVVALLRANSIQAKQIHAKTLSNLLSHGASRRKVVEDGVLYALMKLSQVMLSGTTATTASGLASAPTSGLLRDPSFSFSTSPGTATLASTTGTATLLPPPTSAISSSTDEVLSIGLQALFNLSCNHHYHGKLLSNGVMSYLSAAVERKQAEGSPESGASSRTDEAAFLFEGSYRLHEKPIGLTSHLNLESRQFALAIICNLASYEENHKELMHAQVTDIIRSYVDGDIEARASAAMALRNLSCRQPWVELLCERKTLHMLIIFTQCDHRVVRRFAIEALVNCSLVTDSLHLFAELRVAPAVVTLLESTANALPVIAASSSASCVASSAPADGQEGKNEQVPPHVERSVRDTYMAALRCLLNIAHDDALALALMEDSAMLRLLPLLEYRALGADEGACELAAGLVLTLAGKPRCAEALLHQRAVSLCALLHRRHATSCVIARECLRILMLLSTYQHIQLALCETQAIHVVVSICSSAAAAPANAMTNAGRTRLRECGAVTIRNLTLSITEHHALFYDQVDDGEGSLWEVGGQTGARQKPLDGFDDDDDDEGGAVLGQEGARHTGGFVSARRMLERHLLHGVRYLQEEIGSGLASDRILKEASTAIANLSTVKAFRVAMVRLGVISTLVQLMSLAPQSGLSTSQASATAGRTLLRLSSASPSTLLGRVCAATLHRLAVEDGAAIDSRGLLVPSLLLVLRQSDEELQQVRYECEKVSLFSPSEFITLPTSSPNANPSSLNARRFTHVYARSASEISRASALKHQGLIGSLDDAAAVISQTTAAASSRQASLRPNPRPNSGDGRCDVELQPTALTATMQCVRQTYRDQKWMVYVLKTTLSSQTMNPALEKKQVRSLGLAKLSFQDLTPSSRNVAAEATTWPPGNGSSSSRSSRSSSSGPSYGDMDSAGLDAPTGGYLLPVSMEKHVICRVNGAEEIMPMSAAPTESPMDLRRASACSLRPTAHGANFSANPNANMGIPAFRSNRSAKVSGGSSSGGFSPSSSGYGDSSNNHSGGVHATPYEHWRRLRRARTVSGNSSASTSSTSSFSAYVVNPNTGRPDFGLGSDEEEDDEDLEMMVDDEEEEEQREGLPSVLQHIVAPSLPPPPYPVDPYHFYCKPKPAPVSSSAADVTAALAALFAECGIEAIFHPLKCKFKCLKYVHYSHVEFVVRVYAHQRALLVEFQRRSGSVLLWDGLYRILHQKLTPIIDANAPRCSQSNNQKRVARGSASAVASASMAPASFPPSAPDQVAISTSSRPPEPSAHEGLGAQIWRTLSLTKPTPSSGVEAMKIMLTSRYLDAQREGCAGLAELTEDVQNACLVANAELVAPLVRAAEAADLNMARCAVGALANVARAVPRFPHSELALARRTAQQLRTLGTPVVLAQLEHANERSLFSVELLRECARALGAFAKLASEVEPRAAAASGSMDERCVRVLRQHTKHRDAQLASHCREALEELRLNAI
ncbi:hypothetical protein BBJ28_00002810 [Nothophytophthora sp. Chile5]|nr:hypothetical protein BBJ28_00002810 [Nothophytophthora sp. Chile5]